MDWASVNAIELEIDGTIASGSDATVKFIKATGEGYEYGDLPIAGTLPLPPGQTAFYSANILNARHIPQGMRLGANLDAEAVHAASYSAEGDDLNGVNDEDGVSRVSQATWVGGGLGFVTITYTPCSGTCYINGWVDWNKDGDFGDTDENIIADAAKTNSSDLFIFTIPVGTMFVDDRYYARFRICPAADTCDLPDDSQTDVIDGEIEDYAWDWGTPTAVTLASFDASSSGDAIHLAWETGSELNSVGFNLYRAEAAGGAQTRLNAALIPSAAPGGAQGATYEYVDESVSAGVTYHYWLEDVAADGSSTMHGPVSAQVTPQRRLLLIRPRLEPAAPVLGSR